MRTTLHKITTEDGLQLDGVLYEPDTPTTKILVHVHGMGGNFYGNNFVSAIARSLSEVGVSMFIGNTRGSEYIKALHQNGTNGSETKLFGSAFERFEECIHDINAALTFVKSAGYTTIHLGGHSLGCAKVVYYYNTTHETDLASILLLSPSDMLGLVRANSERHERDSLEAREHIASGEGSRLLEHWIWNEYPVSAQTYENLFGDASETGIFNFFKQDDALEKLSTISVPLFAIMGRKDDALTVSIESTFDRMKKALTKCPDIRTVILGDATHGYRGDEESLAHEVVAWIQSH